jgi:hypothetical protein
MALNLSTSAIENEAFWKHHHEIQKSSGMRRSDYCREHSLNYHRFGYWISRWNRVKNDNQCINLVSVKLKSDETLEKQKILCSLNLKNGNILKIHDTEAFAIILERYA